MEFTIYGLQCDAPTCDYRDDTIQFEAYESYINHPCPLCGAPLLTQADYDTTLEILQMVKSVEEGSIQDPNQKEEQYKLSVKLDGTGVPIFDAQKIE